SATTDATSDVIPAILRERLEQTVDVRPRVVEVRRDPNRSVADRDRDTAVEERPLERDLVERPGQRDTQHGRTFSRLERAVHGVAPAAQLVDEVVQQAVYVALDSRGIRVHEQAEAFGRAAETRETGDAGLESASVRGERDRLVVEHAVV